MGCTASRDDPASVKSKDIDVQLRKYHQVLHKQVKMLLLGPGESGKSTVFKQMKIIQDNGGFSRDELLSFRHIIHANCISQMRVILQASTNLQVPFGSQEVLTAAQKLLQLPQHGSVMTREIADIIRLLWGDKGVRCTYDLRGKKYQLNDTADYFFDNIDRFGSEDYTPTPDDVLRARVRSTGIEEAEFTYDKLTFTMVDVGGQRSERRKWIHCFDCVTAVIFCAALSGYDQTLREDNSQNRMAEAILLFDEVSNAAYFKDNAIILFLNKTDLFDIKIKEVPLTVCFKEYSGSQDPDNAKKYIKERFLEKAHHHPSIYPHFTCALNTKNIEFVIKTVKDTLLRETLAEVGVSL